MSGAPPQPSKNLPFTHGECFCARGLVIRLRPMSWLPKISMGLTLDALAPRL